MTKIRSSLPKYIKLFFVIKLIHTKKINFGQITPSHCPKNWPCQKKRFDRARNNGDNRASKKSALC